MNAILKQALGVSKSFHMIENVSMLNIFLKSKDEILSELDNFGVTDCFTFIKSLEFEIFLKHWAKRVGKWLFV